MVASFGTPFVVPDAYRFLDIDLLVPPTQVPPTQAGKPLPSSVGATTLPR